MEFYVVNLKFEGVKKMIIVTLETITKRVHGLEKRKGIHLKNMWVLKGKPSQVARRKPRNHDNLNNNFN